MKRYRLLLVFLLIYTAASGARSRLPQVGFASYYGEQANHHKTASGERYCADSFTAAHRTLPFGTILKVTNLTNHRFIFVRINDRGPHRRHRIIDLSGAAARSLALMMCGTTRVRIERARRSDMARNKALDSSSKNAVSLAEAKPDSASSSGAIFTVRAGTFSSGANALRLKKYLRELHYENVTIKKVRGRRRRWYYRVMIGSMNTTEKEKCMRLLKDKGINARAMKQ